MVEKTLFQKLFSNEKIRYIPAMTVNGESLIKAFKPEKIIINGYSTDKVYIGESIIKLDEYEILLNINLEGVMSNE